MDKTKKNTLISDADINQALISMGKNTTNIKNSKQLVNSFVNTLTSSPAKPIITSKTTNNYVRPEKTFTDSLTSEDIEKKLEDYIKINDLGQVALGTHIRYFQEKDGKLLFRMGGVLKRNQDATQFIILRNAQGVEWSVQTANNIFFKKMILPEIKAEYDKIILELNSKINKLKKEIKVLKNN